MKLTPCLGVAKNTSLGTCQIKLKVEDEVHIRALWYQSLNPYNHCLTRELAVGALIQKNILFIFIFFFLLHSDLIFNVLNSFLLHFFL